MKFKGLRPRPGGAKYAENLDFQGGPGSFKHIEILLRGFKYAEILLLKSLELPDTLKFYFSGGLGALNARKSCFSGACGGKYAEIAIPKGLVASNTLKSCFSGLGMPNALKSCFSRLGAPNTLKSCVGASNMLKCCFSGAWALELSCDLASQGPESAKYADILLLKELPIR